MAAAPDIGMMTDIMQQFQIVFRSGSNALLPMAGKIFGALATIEIVVSILFWALSGDMRVSKLLEKFMMFGAYIYLIKSLADGSLTKQIFNLFSTAGFTAGGGTALAGTISDPSSIISLGFTASKPILDHLNGMDALFSPVDAFLSCFSAIIIMFAYFVIALQVFLTYIEFGIVSTLGVILMPFGAWKHTRFMAEKCIGGVISFGIKIMTLSFIISVTMPILQRFKLPTDPTIDMNLKMLFAVLAIAIICWQGPALAAAILAGSPSLTAGVGAQGAAAAGMVMAAGAAAAAPAVGAGLSALKGAAASGLGGALQGAKDGSSGGSSPMSTVASAVAGGASAAGASLANSVKSGAENMFRPSANQVKSGADHVASKSVSPSGAPSSPDNTAAGSDRATPSSSSTPAATPSPSPRTGGGLANSARTAATVKGIAQAVAPPDAQPSAGADFSLEKE